MLQLSIVLLVLVYDQNILKQLIFAILQHCLTFFSRNINIHSSRDLDILQVNKCLSLRLFKSFLNLFTGPLSYTSQSCATQCEGRKHGYEIGKTYDYDLTTTVLTTIPSGTEDLSSLKLTALAHVEALSECDLALRVSLINHSLSIISNGLTF